MDISEFEKLVKPSSKRSSLELFRSQIFELKNKGYADRQIRDWLAANGLEVTRQTVQIFIKKSKGMPISSPAPTQAFVEVEKIKAVIPEPIQPATENSPVNLQDKFKEHLASVRSENYAEPIEKNTGAQIKRRSKSVLKPEKVDEWQEHRKKMGLPNTIDDEWRNKPTEEE